MDKKLTKIIMFFEKYFNKSQKLNTNFKSDKSVLISNLRKILDDICGINLSVIFLPDKKFFTTDKLNKLDSENIRCYTTEDFERINANHFSEEKNTSANRTFNAKLSEFPVLFNIGNLAFKSTVKLNFNSPKMIAAQNKKISRKLIDNFLHKFKAKPSINSDKESLKYKDNSCFRLDKNNFFDITVSKNSFGSRNIIMKDFDFSKLQNEDFNTRNITNSLKSFIEMTETISVYNNRLKPSIREDIKSPFRKTPVLDSSQLHSKRKVNEKNFDKIGSNLIKETVPVLSTENQTVNLRHLAAHNLKNISFEESMRLEKQVKEIFVSVIDDFNRLKGF